MRSDVHRPAALVTEDYEYEFSEVNYEEGLAGWVLRRGDWGLEMSRWINRTDRLGRGTRQCHHCGAHLNYFAVLRHKPTGDAIVVGETCLGNRFELATADFHRLRKERKLDRERIALAESARQWLVDNPAHAWLGDEQAVRALDNEFVLDLHRKLPKYGGLTERQVEAAEKVRQRAAERIVRAAEDEARTWVAVREGRVEVAGEVAGLKWVEHDFGSTQKMLLRVDDEDGSWKLWLSVPRALHGVERGERVKLVATVERSHDDEHFGYGKRPAKAEWIERNEEEA